MTGDPVLETLRRCLCAQTAQGLGLGPARRREMLGLALLENEQWPECGETGAGSVSRCDELKPTPPRQTTESRCFPPYRDIESIKSAEVRKHAGIGAQAPIGVRRETRRQIAWCDRNGLQAGKSMFLAFCGFK